MDTKRFSRDLWEECELCEGKGIITLDRAQLVHLPLDPPTWRPTVLRDGSFECPSCTGKCFTRTGLTIGQVEAMMSRLAAAKTQASSAHGS